MTRGERPPTIADVARIAQVSLPTVSRVLTGSTPVSPATRDRVKAAIKALGYRPNGAARALVQGSQPIVGIIAEDVTAYGPARMIRAVEREARRAGYVVAVAVLDPKDLDATSSSLELLLAQPIGGIVVLDFHRYDQRKLAARLGNLPTASVTERDDREDAFPHVVINDRQGAREIADYLLGLGHRNIHHVGVPGAGGQHHPRFLGWRDALSAAGRPIPQPILTDWSVESGRKAGLALAADPTVTAVLCANDELAFGVMRGLHEAGRAVPADVSVAGMDDQPLARAWVPDLTTFRLDWDWAGAAALGLLLNPAQVTAQPACESLELIVRGSTAPPP